MIAEEAEAALNEAETVPLSEDRISEIVKFATDPGNKCDNNEQAQLAAAVKRLRERVAALEAALGTEQSMHQAWRKRAEECEALVLAHSARHPFHGIEGLKPVDRADLAEYEAAMKEAIPEMIEAVRERERLAHESKQRFMG